MGMSSAVAQRVRANPCRRDGCGGSLFPGADADRCLLCGRPAEGRRVPPPLAVVTQAQLVEYAEQTRLAAIAASTASKRGSKLQKVKEAREMLARGLPPTQIRHQLEISTRTWERWRPLFKEEDGECMYLGHEEHTEPMSPAEIMEARGEGRLC